MGVTIVIHSAHLVPWYNSSMDDYDDYDEDFDEFDMDEDESEDDLDSISDDEIELAGSFDGEFDSEYNAPMYGGYGSSIDPDDLTDEQRDLYDTAYHSGHNSAER